MVVVVVVFGAGAEARLEAAGASKTQQPVVLVAGMPTRCRAKIRLSSDQGSHESTGLKTTDTMMNKIINAKGDVNKSQSVNPRRLPRCSGRTSVMPFPNREYEWRSQGKKNGGKENGETGNVKEKKKRIKSEENQSVHSAALRCRHSSTAATTARCKSTIKLRLSSLFGHGLQARGGAFFHHLRPFRAYAPCSQDMPTSLILF